VLFQNNLLAYRTQHKMLGKKCYKLMRKEELCQTSFSNYCLGVSRGGAKSLYFTSKFTIHLKTLFFLGINNSTLKY